MLSKRLLARVARLPKSTAPMRPCPPAVQFSSIGALRAQVEDADPEMNGGYVNPTNDPYPLKRQFRDPYHPWWDKQERRDFGEPVHEDNDILGIFSLEEYTHMSPGRGLLLWSGFIATILGLGYAVSQTYPDRPSAPKEYPGGLETELGGPRAPGAWKEGDKL